MLEEYKDLNRKWKIYVMHHTHTDIGYTDSQEVITDRQIDYIKQAIELSEVIAAGERKEWKGFKWICEAFWGVEQFLGLADEQLKERLKSDVNFDAALGGFHQINYGILSGFGTLTPEELIRKAQDMNGLALCFRIDS